LSFLLILPPPSLRPIFSKKCKRTPPIFLSPFSPGQGGGGTFPPPSCGSNLPKLPVPPVCSREFQFLFFGVEIQAWFLCNFLGGGGEKPFSPFSTPVGGVLLLGCFSHVFVHPTWGCGFFCFSPTKGNQGQLVTAREGGSPPGCCSAGSSKVLFPPPPLLLLGGSKPFFFLG